MDKKENARFPIQAPQSDKRREVTRAVAEGSAGLVPFAGQLVARILRVTHPPKSEQDRKEWQKAISERANEHEARLDEHERRLNPEIEIQGLPAEIAALLIKSCPDGFGDQRFDSETIGQFFPESRQLSL